MDSDLDLIVDLNDRADLFTLVRLERDLGALLGVDVDVVPADSLPADTDTSAWVHL